MTEHFEGYASARGAIDTLAKKFPLTDDGKKDIKDAKAILAACKDADPENFEDLVEASAEIARLKRRLKSNANLALAAKNTVFNGRKTGPDAHAVVKSLSQLRSARSSKKSEEEKAKEVADHLTKVIASCASGGLYWGGALSGCKLQTKRMTRIGLHIADARKVLKEKIYDSPDDAKHLKLATMAWKDLKLIDQKISTCYGAYWVMEVEIEGTVSFFARFFTEASTSLAKLKAKSAVAFLKKLAA